MRLSTHTLWPTPSVARATQARPSGKTGMLMVSVLAEMKSTRMSFCLHLACGRSPRRFQREDLPELFRECALFRKEPLPGAISIDGFNIFYNTLHIASSYPLTLNHLPGILGPTKKQVPIQMSLPFGENWCRMPAVNPMQNRRSLGGKLPEWQSTSVISSAGTHPHSALYGRAREKQIPISISSGTSIHTISNPYDQEDKHHE
jgi:hypothetical protein